MLDDLLAGFARPPKPFAGAPFWAWNGELEPEELRRQIRIFHKMGLGGFFMHSRVGLETEYLGDKWFECIEACIDEASKLGMGAWLYDEDRWPSGYAGGVATRDPANQAKFLVAEEMPAGSEIRWTKDVVAAFTARIDGDRASAVAPVRKGAAPKPPKGHALVVFRMRHSNADPWWNGATYLDTMSESAVRAFIDSTHEVYKARIGEHFGKAVPGIFTDEPNTGPVHGCFPQHGSLSGLPWTPGMLDAFRARTGYDLRPHLMELAYDVEGVEDSHARWAYHDCRTHLFVQAFSRQISEWCGENGLLHTGHVLLEETLADQAGVVGSAMRFYEFMQAPGMDLLTEYRREIDNAKQVASVARQMGRAWRLTETYGCTGWDFPLAAHKSIGDWQAALGINLRCHHLSWYTMQGEAKRDYPASIHFQSPWWDAHSAVEDHFARTHWALSQGSEVRDLLVIHPVESMWLRVRKGWRGAEDVAALNGMLPALRDALLDANIDFDYGDEEMLSRLASVAQDGDGAVVRVGEASYKAVVVPPMRTIRSSTLRLLAAFRDAGGLVVFAGPPSPLVDVAPSTMAAELAARCVQAPAKGRKLAQAVQSARRVSIADAQGGEIATAIHQLREADSHYALFIANLDAEIAKDKQKPFGKHPAMKRRGAIGEAFVSLMADTEGAPLELDTTTGAVLRADAERSGNAWRIKTSLGVAGSRLFLFPKAKQSSAPPKRVALRTASKRAVNPKAWDYSLSEDNALVLDRPKLRIDGGRWIAPKDVLHADRLVRDHLGLLHRGGGMEQPWSIPKSDPPRRARVELSYSFGVDALPAAAVSLAIERPEKAQAWINGTELDCSSANGWWVDPCIRRIPVPAGALRKGANEARLSIDYDDRFSGLEIAYLLGHFGVRASGGVASITHLPARLVLGDWTRQGLPFYSGNVAYRARIAGPKRKGARTILALGEFRGAAARVVVDGAPAGVAAWPPYEIDITDLLAPGGSEVAIEVLSHRRNAFGPLHYPDPWPYGTGPGTFTTFDSKEWSDAHVLVPCGLIEAPTILLKEAGTVR